MLLNDDCHGSSSNSCVLKFLNISHEITEISVLAGSMWGTTVAVYEIINSKIRFILGLSSICGKARVGL